MDKFIEKSIGAIVVLALWLATDNVYFCSFVLILIFLGIIKFTFTFKKEDLEKLEGWHYDGD